MPNVTVPAAFFQAELRVYSDWREALARELLQNSFDAHARTIEIKLSDVDGRAVLEFDDDGDGMSREVLEEVYFALGQTTKTAGDTVGGFGRARIITCFAQRRYEIRTRDCYVEGHGGEYELRTAEPVNGCRFRIELVDDDTRRMRNAFERVLGTCNTTVDVTVDGRRISGYPLPGRAARVFRDEAGREWAKVYVGRRSIGQLLVRVNGLTMFSRYLPGYDDVVVELSVRRSRDLLAASRDRLVDVYAEQVDRFIEDLTQNRQRALSDSTASVNIHVRGGGFFVNAAAAAPQAGVPGSGAPDSGVLASGNTGGSLSDSLSASAAALTSALDACAAHYDRDTGHTTCDVFLFARNDSTAARRLMRTWDPRRWKPGTNLRRRALLAGWVAALDAAIGALQAHRPSTGPVCWTAGWVFDPDTEALHRRVGSAHVFALHPQPTAAGYQLNRAEDRRRLLAVAAHEVCHVLSDRHDELFASLLTDLYGKLDPAVADKAIRAAANQARRDGRNLGS